jgi:hypothetical protein
MKPKELRLEMSNEVSDEAFVKSWYPDAYAATAVDISESITHPKRWKHIVRPQTGSEKDCVVRLSEMFYKTSEAWSDAAARIRASQPVAESVLASIEPLTKACDPASDDEVKMYLDKAIRAMGMNAANIQWVHVDRQLARYAIEQTAKANARIATLTELCRKLGEALRDVSRPASLMPWYHADIRSRVDNALAAWKDPL